MLQITSGTANVSTPAGLDSFALAKTAGVPNTVLIAVGVLLLVTFVISKTVLGRRFVAVGASPAAARAAGIPVRAYEVGTYIVAALAYGGAGILIAGFCGRRASRPGTTTCCRRSRPSSWAARRSRAAEAA